MPTNNRKKKKKKIPIQEEHEQGMLTPLSLGE